MYQATKLGDQAIIKIDGDAEKLLTEIVRQNAQVLAINADLLAKLSFPAVGRLEPAPDLAEITGTR